jgi:peptidyl-tRNA hydrolase
VVRKDLEPGLQMAQSCHVVFSFSQEHPNETKTWMNNSNYIAVLNSPDENDLQRLIEQADAHNIRFSIFREPDIGDQITAIALEPGQKSKKLCSKLPLALKS